LINVLHQWRTWKWLTFLSNTYIYAKYNVSCSPNYLCIQSISLTIRLHDGVEENWIHVRKLFILIIVLIRKTKRVNWGLHRMKSNRQDNTRILKFSLNEVAELFGLLKSYYIINSYILWIYIYTEKSSICTAWISFYLFSPGTLFPLPIRLTVTI
jgi:hypothetical protein